MTARRLAKGARSRVTPQTRLIVWTRAVGRCHYCNAPLLGDLMAGRDTLNKGYIAHIVAEKPDGPRGDPVRSPLLVNDPANLMLMCDPHHRLIDHPETWRDYPEKTLLAMKAAHESRVATVTDITADRASHALLYGAKIGAIESPVSFTAAKRAMLPGRYPAENEPVVLELRDTAYRDTEADFWRFHSENLERQFNERVRPRLASRSLGHLSVFAVAPQPLLIQLGAHLNDLNDAAIHQLHREPPGWDWRADRPLAEFSVQRPLTTTGPIALKFEISAMIDDARVRKVLGPDASIWSVAATGANNNIINSQADLSTFRVAARQAFAAIKQIHGEGHDIHLFPAMPVSTAVETGRVWMPKADLALQLYDQNRTLGGFVPCLRLPLSGTMAQGGR